MATLTQWRGQRDTSRWRLRVLVLASALLHVPLSPLGALLGLVDLGEDLPATVVDLNAITAIPVEIEGSGASSQPDPTPTPDSEAREPEPKLDEELFEDLSDLAAALMDDLDDFDAGVYDAGESEPEVDLDAGVAAEDVDASEAGSDEAVDGGPEAGTPGMRDPVAMTGSAGQVADANANVRLLLYTERIRSHVVGARVSELLRNTWQWQDFFGAGGLDPLQDVDRILIAGPQLRDSSEVIAVVRYNVSRDQAHGAVDRLVQRDRSGGSWLDAGVAAAEASADGAPRVFVMPAPEILVVAPPSAKRSALSLPADIDFPAPVGAEAVNVYLVTPWRALMGLRFSIPQSVKWARITVTPTPDGGALGEVVAEDESAEAAARTSAQMERRLKGYAVLDFIESVTFVAQGSEIHGKVAVTKNQLAFLLELALQQQQKYLQQATQRRAAEAARAGDAGPGTGAPPAAPLLSAAPAVSARPPGSAAPAVSARPPGSAAPAASGAMR